MITDIEFYELRYSGKPAAFLRGFRALYLGVFFNVMSWRRSRWRRSRSPASCWASTPHMTVVLGGAVTAVYSTLGGLRGVLITDFFQFIVAMAGAFVAA